MMFAKVLPAVASCRGGNCDGRLEVRISTNIASNYSATMKIQKPEPLTHYGRIRRLPSCDAFRKFSLSGSMVSKSPFKCLQRATNHFTA
eukprot:2510397-Pleurochrysis_carterae.AAC.1